MMNLSELELKYGHRVKDYAVDVCLQLREDNTSIDYPKDKGFEHKMRERFPKLNNEELGFLFHYGMMTTR